LVRDQTRTHAGSRAAIRHAPYADERKYSQRQPLAITPVLSECTQASEKDASTFRPGWEDIFRMNQKQLEAAIHRVSNDDSLEPTRKAYLIQNIMVSRWVRCGQWLAG
jgi:hypothetical protein